MGIPRLTRDVLPYAESAVLGNCSDPITSLQIRKLVIDGPSLVHHVCDRLLNSYASRTDYSLPSYAVINKWLTQYLDDIAGCGVEIIKIVFDGGLPLDKRDVRFERMGKSRQRLENACKTLSRPPLRRIDATVINETDFWRPSPIVAHSLLPLPPFMVPSALEHLQTSRWAEKTIVVPGEADPYCARIAVNTDASIMSNDSDLLLYDIADNAVINFHHLELDTCSPDQRILKAQCFRPWRIAKKLGVTSLRRFAFARSLDSGATPSTISARVRDLSTAAEHQKSYELFCDKYDVTRVCGPSTYLLTDIDPRAAELIVSIPSGDSLHNYLPTLIEDHSRHSSWFYGTDIRRLAYSILCTASTHKPDSCTAPHVTEFTRSGLRIGSEDIQCFSSTRITQEIDLLVSLLKTNKARLELEGSSSTPSRFLLFHVFASHLVIKQRIERGATIESGQIYNFYSIEATVEAMEQRTWSDVHLQANIQAVLYSLRILYQITNHCLSQYSMEKTGETLSVSKTSPQHLMQRLLKSLRDMPCIEDLFLDNNDLPSKLQACPPEIRERGMSLLLEMITSSSIAVASRDMDSLAHRESITGKRATVPKSSQVTPCFFRRATVKPTTSIRIQDGKRTEQTAEGPYASKRSKSNFAQHNRFSVLPADQG